MKNCLCNLMGKIYGLFSLFTLSEAPRNQVLFIIHLDHQLPPIQRKIHECKSLPEVYGLNDLHFCLSDSHCTKYRMCTMSSFVATVVSKLWPVALSTTTLRGNTRSNIWCFSSCRRASIFSLPQSSLYPREEWSLSYSKWSFLIFSQPQNRLRNQGTKELKKKEVKALSDWVMPEGFSGVESRRALCLIL
jgi:hypothetical protein